MDVYSASVWPRLEPFLLGALQAAPPGKLSVHYLRKMASYVRTREGCFPRLGWHMWRHIACGKLQLPEDLAWLYFETFDLLAPRSPEEKLEWAEALSQCQSPRELDRQRSKLSVDTLHFLLFLYLQQLNRVSLRTSLIGEEWPSPRSRSPASFSEREAKASSHNKNWDDQAHLTFVQTHLTEILELLAEPGELSSSGQPPRDGQLLPAALQGLSLLLEGSASHGRAVHPLHRLLGRAPFQTQAGYSKLSRSYSLQKLQSWLHQALTLNPFGMSTCLRSGKKLAWALQVEGTMKRAKIARNTHLAPPGSRVVLMSQLYKQTLAKDSEKLADANVKLHRCNEAFIYLLSPLRSVTLDKCRNSTVVLGPVVTSVHVQSCESVRLVCVAARLAVGASSHCTIHILTPTRPLLLPGNVALTLGPFHTYYPTLEDHMASVGLAVVPNLWDKPLLFGADGPTPDPASYRILPPAEFWPLVVPFQMEGDTCEVPGGLPPTYQQAVEAREQRVQDWQKTVKDAHLNKEQRRQFQVLVEQKFHEWLLERGQRQELDSLLPAAVTPSHPTDSALSTCGSQPSLHRPKEQAAQRAVGRTPTVC
ncbi:TBCC domain-containing protein 1 isoform X1 [Electrophorus electricus]|uniref:TBCC domain-containing protein 1 n=1 Tax=Electrophorus electricus TaxID=8005 RepID=A0A4W4GSN1_ELEEL|nr:TBCC domain-containing protein 1 isoform X1 [Electrophorus electricus]XP_026851942.2 TBCC domain-containing protein 1 isoform X1 [Electrophorus electricus]